VTSLELMSWYLLITELRFVVMLYSNLDKENADMGHMKCSHRMHLACKPQIPTPGLGFTFKVLGQVTKTKC